MKMLSPLLVGFCAAACSLSVQASTPTQPAAPLYVQVDTDNPTRLARLEGTNHQEEFAEDTLRSAAHAMASAAQWTSPLIVLHRGENAPNNAAVLRLILPEGTAEFLFSAKAKSIFLGRVGALSARENYPDPYAFRDRLNATPLAGRPILRKQIEIEKDLFVSLQTLERKIRQNYLSGVASEMTPSH